MLICIYPPLYFRLFDREHIIAYRETECKKFLPEPMESPALPKKERQGILHFSAVIIAVHIDVLGFLESGMEF